MPDFTAFDGVAIGPSTPYDIKILYGQDAAYTSAPELRSGIGRVPARDAIVYGGREIPFTIFKGTSGASDAQWQQDVYQLFSPLKQARLLTATHNATTITLTVDIGSLRRIHDRVYEGTFVCADPVWRTITTTTDAASPLTVVGNAPALPVITLTPNTSQLARRRITVTDVTGRGLVNYPVRATVDTTGFAAAATSDYILFYNGRPIPFYLQTPNNAASTLDFRVDVPPLGSVFVDLYYGSSVTNTITAQAYDPAGMDITHASYSATQWVWKTNEFDQVGTRPAATGVWRYGVVDQHASGGSFGVVATPTTLAFISANDNSLANDADSLIVVIGAEAGSTDALQGIAGGNTFNTGQTYVRYRKAGESLWRQATATLIAGYPTNPNQYKYDLDGAVEIAIRNSGALLQADGNTPWRLALTNVPTVNVAAAVTARYINSAFTNTTTGASISLTDVYLDDVALTINCVARTIAPASGPLYGAFVFSNPVDWLPLAVGTTAWTAPTNTTASIAWATRYVI